jgi:hypothetical protein
MEQRFKFFTGRTGFIVMVGIGVVVGSLNAYFWRLPPDESKLINTLAVMNQKLDLIWKETSSVATASRNVDSESAVTELPVIQLNGGSIKLRFKHIGDSYHYECSIEGGIDAISRLIAPNGKTVLLKATFADKDNFDVTDLTLSGLEFAIKEQGEGGKDVALNKQGIWENKIDPATIKNWRVEVMDQDNTDTKVGVSPSQTPSTEVQNLAADITVHPTTGKLLLPGSLQDIQDKIAQATPAPTPQSPTPVFQGPPRALPTTPSSPALAEPNVRVEEPNLIMPQQKTIQEKKSN